MLDAYPTPYLTFEPMRGGHCFCFFLHENTLHIIAMKYCGVLWALLALLAASAALAAAQDAPGEINAPKPRALCLLSISKCMKGPSEGVSDALAH